MRSETRRLTEGAMASGIYAVLLLLSYYTPFGVVTTLLLPVPFVVYAARHRIGDVVVMAAVCTLLTVLLTGVASLFLPLWSSLTGGTMGVVYRQRREAYWAFSAGMIATLVSFLLFLVVMNFLFSVNLLTEMRRLMEESLQMSQSLLQRVGLEAPENPLLAQLPDMFVALFPFLLFFSAATASLLVHWLGGTILRRLGTPVPRLPAFHTWRFPRLLLYLYLPVLLYMFVPAESRWAPLEPVLMNLQPAFEVLFVLQGLSFIFFLTEIGKWPKSVRIIAVVGLFLPPFSLLFSLAFSILGIVDVGFPLRERLRSS
ncbi:MAG: hypothetical protein A6D91_02930 [Bacillaceae bacterium G1]|nr:hypothetical protein [Bacillota bacterium]OJF17866.1 MAG: hypothetical protein A6D91_02930 [Bacillaceae bacterium G1]